jgi:hypothetical protein
MRVRIMCARACQQEAVVLLLASSGADDEMGGSRHWMTPGSRPDALKLQPLSMRAACNAQRRAFDGCEE